MTVTYESKWLELKVKLLYRPWYVMKPRARYWIRYVKHVWKGAFQGWKQHGGMPHARNGWLRALFFHCPCLHCDPPRLGQYPRWYIENHTTLFRTHKETLRYWFWIYMKSLRIRKYD